ncbi:hypothetical protein HDE_04833 [Halotydeus destructor]|nr:hypothetical protein HDE_04833 [Halotydeus destructor]
MKPSGLMCRLTGKTIGNHDDKRDVPGKVTDEQDKKKDSDLHVVKLNDIANELRDQLLSRPARSALDPANRPPI